QDNAYNLGCACTTVFRRFHLLAGCAAISTRHILTTATSTELILRTRRHFERMTEVLGIWYDINDNSFNSSYYAYPNRIHYHPRYVKPKEVNRSHPIPAMYDLSVWSTTYNLYGSSMSPSGAYICNRGGSHWMEYGSSVPGPRELALIAGFQFIKAYRRKPMPWFKYAVRTRKHTYPCPKSEWGWFHCIPGDWAPLGLDSGATYFRSLEGYGWRYDGLIGMNAVSMRLRSIPIVHYFTVLNTHEVLDFLYGAFTGHLPYEWLDQRYENTKERSPITKKVQVPRQYDPAHPYYYGKEIPNYK
ncbi:uncharacterized protein LOC114365989, partial [Ostrinia furnacalis]|uniref:uncharacterized protein LOC114365989 n=1 Tax=Ostrinia furnacalis TaxID=93504 RepID=UPI00103E469D